MSLIENYKKEIAILRSDRKYLFIPQYLFDEDGQQRRICHTFLISSTNNSNLTKTVNVRVI